MIDGLSSARRKREQKRGESTLEWLWQYLHRAFPDLKDIVPVPLDLCFVDERELRVLSYFSPHDIPSQLVLVSRIDPHKRRAVTPQPQEIIDSLPFFIKTEGENLSIG